MYAVVFPDDGVTFRGGVMQPTRAPCHVEIETLAHRAVRDTGRETPRDIGNAELEATAYDVIIAKYLGRDWKTKSAVWDVMRDEMGWDWMR